MVGVEVRDADGADLPLLLQFIERPHRLCDGGNHEGGIRQRGEVDEKDAIGKGRSNFVRRLQAEPRLARPSWSGQGQ